VNGLKVEKRRKVVLFEREVDGVLGWYENGDEREDNKFVGEIKNGKQNGEGTQTYPDGRKYVGEWKNGEYHGQGSFTSPDGNKYDGEWKDGTYHGHGTYTFGKVKWEGDKSSILENTRMEKRMDKEHTLFLMEESTLGNSSMGKNMVKEHSLHLMETSM